MAEGAGSKIRSVVETEAHPRRCAPYICERGFMASKKKRPTRSTDDYLASAKSLSKLVPSLKKFKARKTLTKSEKASIRRRERQLKNIPFLVPVTKPQAKKLGRQKLFLPGIQAVQLRNVQAGASIKIRGKDIEVQQNGQRWIYWALDRDTVRSRRGMRTAGDKAFNKQFPIEKVSDLTAKAFAKYRVQQVHLWAHAGIVGDAFEDLQQFIMWVNEKWNQGRYVSTHYKVGGDIYSTPSDPGKWVNGIAILVENTDYTTRRKELDAAEKAAPKTKKLVSRKRRKT